MRGELVYNEREYDAQEVHTMKEDMMIARLYDLRGTIARPLLENLTYPWEALPLIGSFIVELGKTLSPAEYELRGENIWVAKSAKLYPNIYIAGPAIIGPNTEVRPGAFIRGNALIGAGCVVGNSTEIKNAILFDGAQAPHYNYIGDSILGCKAHTGAGAITSNLKQDHSPVTIRTGGERVETAMRKFGAMLGDHVEIGCGSVLNPGTVVGRGARVYPLSMVRGFVPAHSIYKRAGEIAEIRDA